MPVKPEQIKARLRAIFPKANLSTSRLDALAAKLSQKPADDADDAAIDDFLTAYNDDAAMTFEELAKHDDKLRTLEAKAKGSPSTDQPSGGTAPTATTAETKTDDDTPAWAKALLDKVQALEQKQQGMTLEQKAKSFRDRAKAKNIPDILIKRVQVTDDFNEDDVLTELETEFREFAKEAKLAGFGNDAPPGGTGKPNGKKEASLEEAQKIGL